MISESNSGLIYANGQKRYIPLKFAVPISFLVSLLSLIIFSLIGAGSNALLAQIEIILLAIFFCLPGILTRSKLRGILFSVPTTWAVIIVYEFIIGGLLGSASYNPYSVFGVLKEPILGIIESNAGTLGFTADTVIFGGTTVKQLLDLLIVLDLLILFLVFFFGSFFASSVATLFWDNEGNLKIFAVILKPFAIVFAILFLLILPLTIHAVSSTTGAAGYIVGGLGELYAGFTPNGVVAGQDIGIDFTNIDVENLREHSSKAKSNFKKADERFNQLKGNLFFSFTIDQLPPEYRNIDTVLNLVSTLAEVSGVMPEIYFILFNAEQGLTLTTSAISSAETSDYDPNFKTGLDFIDLGFSNFTKAWNCKDAENPDGRDNCGLVYGIEEAQKITDIGQLEETINIEQFITTLDGGVDALDKSWPAINPFLNGTYKTILATIALGENNLTKASSIITDATGDFIQSESVLASVTDVQPINITAGDQVIPIPIDGVINLAKDLNSLLIPFSYSAANGIDFFLAMQNLMAGMADVDMSDNSTIGGAGDLNMWDGLSNNLATASAKLSLASSNISIANNLMDLALANPRYGQLNPVFVGEAESDTVFRTVKTVIDEFDTSLQLLSEMFTALTYSFEAFKAFGQASSQVHLALTDNPTKTVVLGHYEDALEYSALAWEELDNMTTSSGSFLSNSAKIGWMESFIWPSSPSNNPTDLNSTFIGFGDIPLTYNGLWVVSKVMIELLNSTLLTSEIDAILDIVNDLGIGDLFG